MMWVLLMDIGLLVVIIHTIAYTVKRMDDGVERGHRSAFRPLYNKTGKIPVKRHVDHWNAG